MGRWRSYFNLGRYAKYDNFYMVCLPKSDYEQKSSRSLSRHNVENSVSYYFTKTTPVTAKNYAGIQDRRAHQAPQLPPGHEGRRDGLPQLVFRDTDHIDGLQRFAHRFVVEHQALKAFNSSTTCS